VRRRRASFDEMDDLVRTAEQCVNVPGGSVYVKRWQPLAAASDVPIVLLHDSLGCVELWREFPELLCRTTGRPVVAYDRLGFGRSLPRRELPSPRFVSEEAEVYLPPLLDALGIERLVLCGHSVGGGMALIGAGYLRPRCAAVITESAQAFVEQRTLEGIARAKSGFEDPRAFDKLRLYHGDKAEWVLQAWTETWSSEAFARWSLAEDLPKVHCPSLIIHGDQDEYGSIAFPETIARLASGPSQMHVISGCGHVPHRSHREVVLAWVRDFLRAL
jgi:pimeloyl-ACP methyl ester carboxylesterase